MKNFEAAILKFIEDNEKIKSIFNRGKQLKLIDVLSNS
jgi:hypothetical protein